MVHLLSRVDPWAYPKILIRLGFSEKPGTNTQVTCKELKKKSFTTSTYYFLFIKPIFGAFLLLGNCLGAMTFSITTLSINALDSECFYAECQLCLASYTSPLC